MRWLRLRVTSLQWVKWKGYIIILAVLVSDTLILIKAYTLSHPKNDCDGRHWAPQMIHVTRRILHNVSIPGCFLERVRKHTWCYTHDNMHLPLEYTLTSLLFLRRYKVSIGLSCTTAYPITGVQHAQYALGLFEIIKNYFNRL